MAETQHLSKYPPGMIRENIPSPPLLLFADHVTALDRELLGRVKIETIATAENMMVDGERLFVVGDSRVVCLTLEGVVL